MSSETQEKSQDETQKEPQEEATEVIETVTKNNPSFQVGGKIFRINITATEEQRDKPSVDDLNQVTGDPKTFYRVTGEITLGTSKKFPIDLIETRVSKYNNLEHFYDFACAILIKQMRTDLVKAQSRSEQTSDAIKIMRQYGICTDALDELEKKPKK